MDREQVTYRKIFDAEIFEGILTSHKFPWHFHNSYTVIIIDSGVMEYVFKEDKILVKQGHVLIINPNIAHYNQVANNTACSYRAMFLPIKLFNPVENQQSVPLFENAANATVYNNLSSMYDQLSESTDQEQYDKIIKEISNQLICNFKITTVSLLDKRIGPALFYISAHLDEKLTIAMLAAICNISHYCFQRIFKSETGLTVKAYIQQCRMEYSRLLLREGVKPVFTSLESGFFDQSHFYKQFKRMYALTPLHLVK